jgi:hypothetical protein
VTARWEDKHARCDLAAQTESHPEHVAFVRALIDGFAVSEEDRAEGVRFLVYAMRGFGMRHHFDRYHPDQVELGITAAPVGGPARDAWLFGYRFVEREKPSAELAERRLVPESIAPSPAAGDAPSLEKDFHALYSAALDVSESVVEPDRETPPQRNLRAQLRRLMPAFEECEAARRMALQTRGRN